MAQDGEGWGLEEGAFKTRGSLGKSHGPETGEWQALQEGTWVPKLVSTAAYTLPTLLA